MDFIYVKCVYFNENLSKNNKVRETERKRDLDNITIIHFNLIRGKIACENVSLLQYTICFIMSNV